MRSCSQGAPRKPIYLPGLTHWVPHVRSWPNLKHRHDVSEFWGHLIERAEPTKMAGTWEARYPGRGVHRVRDSALLWTPIPMDMPATDLQSLISGWSNQHYPHALAAETPFFTIQVKRYFFHDIGHINVWTRYCSGLTLSSTCPSFAQARVRTRIMCHIAWFLSLHTRRHATVRPLPGRPELRAAFLSNSKQ